jgi:hypothetical protein
MTDKPTPEQIAQAAFDKYLRKPAGEPMNGNGHAAPPDDDWKPPTEIPAGDIDVQDAAEAQNERPLIQIKGGVLSEIASEGEKVLLEAGVQLYQRGGFLVRPIIEDAEAAHGARTKVARLGRIDATYLRDLLGRIARFKKYDARSKKWVPTDPSLEMANTILARVGEWKFPVVSGVISAPTLRPDGSILDQPGYDPATQLLLINPPAMPAIPAAPTREEAHTALILLEGLLAEFPFSDAEGGDKVSRVVALSALITPVVRGAFPVTPMHVNRAPVAASGKSYLFDLAAVIATGQKMPVIAAGRSEDETEKRLGAAMLAGQPLISIDNVNGQLESVSLCQIIERPIVSIRILGRSENVRVDAGGASTFCTGNNLVLVGDLCRRSLTATLDPELERPELREFKGNPVAAVLTDRGTYVAAALTICRAYIVAGRPGPAPRLASFEGWSDTVRSALMWLGCADPVASIETARAEDPQLNALRGFLGAWADIVGVGWAYRTTMHEIVKLAGQHTGEQPLWPELHSVLEAFASTRGSIDAKRLGAWARAFKGRFADGLRLRSEPSKRGGVATWWIENKKGDNIQGKSQGLDDLRL